jgi:hypothetical protein
MRPKPRKRTILLALTSTHHGFYRGAARYATEHDWHVVADMIYDAAIPIGWKGDGILLLEKDPSSRPQNPRELQTLLRAVRFALTAEPRLDSPAVKKAAKLDRSLKVRDRRQFFAVAVLPFDNLGEDKEDEYLSAVYLAVTKRLPASPFVSGWKLLASIVWS